MQRVKEPQENIHPNEIILNSMEYFFKDAYAFLIGCLASLIGYLLPVKNLVNIIIIFFILDVAFGYWAARKLKGEKFSVKIIWEQTMPRMLISVVLVSCAYAWDTEFKQELVSTYVVTGWFISGVILYSIAKNGYKITKWAAFTQLGDALQEKVKDSTGLDINDKED